MYNKSIKAKQSTKAQLTHFDAHDFVAQIAATKRKEFIVLVELAEGHAQAVVGKDQEHFIQQMCQVLQLQF